MVEHLYVEHRTYTGAGCAICGKSIGEHDGAVIEELLSVEGAEARYPKAYAAWVSSLSK